MLLTVEDMVTAFGEEEMLQIAGEGPRDMRGLDRAKIEESLQHASGLVVGYVRDRWPAAVDGTPMLKGFAADIARWRLRGRGGQQSAMNETVQKRYDEAVARLKDIAAGKLTLDLAFADGTGPEPASSEHRIIASMPRSRLPGLLDGYRS
jgi:phage gp36-like protein